MGGGVVSGGWEAAGVLSNVIRLRLALRNLHFWSPEADQYEDRVRRTAAGSVSPLQQERLAWN